MFSYKNLRSLFLFFEEQVYKKDDTLIMENSNNVKIFFIVEGEFLVF